MADCEKCPLHDNVDACLSIIKIDIKDIERRAEDVGERISAIEPTVAQHEQSIVTMRKLQLGTLVSALISAVGVISGLAYVLINRLD